MNSELLVTPEIARIHAHLCGDGCVYMKRKKRSSRELTLHPRKNLFENDWIMEYTNTSKVLLDEYNNDLMIAFKRKGQWQDKYHRIRIESAKWAIEFLNLREKDSYNWTIPPLIMLSQNKVISAWLRAFFDDEATIMKQGIIRVKSMNKGGLAQVQVLLSRFGISSNLRGPNCDNSYYLGISKNCNYLYHKHISFLHPEKQKKLEELMGDGPTRT